MIKYSISKSEYFLQSNCQMLSRNFVAHIEQNVNVTDYTTTDHVGR